MSSSLSFVSPSPTAVRFDEDAMWVELADGRVLGVPLAWFPRLLSASSAQREKVRLSSRGLHWDELDEDISVAGLLAGFGDQTVRDARPTTVPTA
ncbi:DUF2442 domain-containing protein [Silvibacterium sp.]|uniref:DUF2442 domain-containing protein n=1 Tax=Silvibacterium sp. TaxID=1964179 RepID=UPI0039E41EF5